MKGNYLIYVSLGNAEFFPSIRKLKECINDI